MKKARRNIPSGAWFQNESGRVVCYLIVALSKVDKTLPDLIFSCTRRDAEECIWIISTVIVQLRRKVIRFRFSSLANQLSILIIGMNMMRKRTHVVEKFGIHRPASIFLPQTFANYCSLKLIYCIFQ